MAQLVLNFPNAIAPRLLNSFCAATGWQANIFNPAYRPDLPTDPVTNPESLPNPVSQINWAKARIIDFIKEKSLITELSIFDAEQRTERTTAEATIKIELDVT